ncbi:MAG: MerR family transcriptional regulator [Bacillota bacterium]|nr:MAG: MerR family transcriptional regulator [Bacillota bacterium]
MFVAERMTGLTRRRIRYYEAVGLLEPARTPGNRRLYSSADIRRLLEIKRLLEEGYDLRAIADLAAQGRWDVGGARPTGEARGPASRLEASGLARYEDARARLLGRGPAGSVDRLYPGDAGRLIGRQTFGQTGRPPSVSDRLAAGETLHEGSPEPGKRKGEDGTRRPSSQKPGP